MTLTSLFLFGSLFSTQVLGRGGRPITERKLKPRDNEPWATNDTFTSGPAISNSFADPSLIKVDGTWYAFATNHDGINIQVASSLDFEIWTTLEGHDALPEVPPWVNMGSPITWAPDVNQLDDGTFLLYFSAVTIKSVGNGLHCIGAATSKNVEGPYTPLNTTIACPASQGGAIDAAGFKDWTQRGSGWGYSGSTEIQDENSNSWTQTDWWGGGKGGQRYLVYKIDGNTMGHGGACGNTKGRIVPTPIILQPVAEDGVTVQGEATQILDNIGTEDEGIVEAPSLVKGPTGRYFLFFSSGCFSSGNYTQGYATADTITGPYMRQTPLYVTGDIVDGKALTAPGGGSCYWDAHHFVFHANNPSTSNRAMYEALIDLIGTTIADGLPMNNSTLQD